MANINKYGAPTKKTIGVVGQKYLDLATGTRYICTDVNEIYEKETVDAHPHSFVAITKENFRREYIWEAVGTPSGGSGGGDCDLQIMCEFGFKDIRITKGDYSRVASKLADGVIPNVEILEVTNIDEPFKHSFSIHRVEGIDMDVSGIYLVYDKSQGDYFYIRNDNVIEKGMFD
jgi:hypothetical protein